MKSKIQIRNIRDISTGSDMANEMRRKVNCLTMDYPEVVRHFSTPVYMEGSTVVLVLSGIGNVWVNYRSYSFCKDSLLMFSSSHLFHFAHCSPDIHCLCLFVSKEFMTEMDSTAMVSQRIRYGVRLYSRPVLRLDSSHTDTLSQRVVRIGSTLDNTKHYYYRDVVQNSLFGFFLDLSDVIERYTESPAGEVTTRKESLVQSFIELLVTHYRHEHKVEFYAAQLHVSTHYLTLVVKSATGQSISEWIFEMLYSEARMLLEHSKLSVQEVTTTLNFSDQSAFGKFFKRRSGVPPLEYRRLWSKSE